MSKVFVHGVPENDCIWADLFDALERLGGGFAHFYTYADGKQEYPTNRFTMETKRQLDLWRCRHWFRN